MRNDWLATSAGAPTPESVSLRSAWSSRSRSSMISSRICSTDLPSEIAVRIVANWNSVLIVRSLSTTRSGVSTSSKCDR